MSKPITKRIRLPEGISLKRKVEIDLNYEVSRSEHAPGLETTVLLSLQFAAIKDGVIQRKFLVEMDRVLRWDEIPHIHAEKHKWERVRRKMTELEYDLQDAYLSVAFDTLIAGWQFTADLSGGDESSIDFIIKKKGPRGLEDVACNCAMSELEPYFDIDYEKLDEASRRRLDEQDSD